MKKENQIRFFTFIYAILIVVGVYNHDLWRDELQIWLLCQDSETFIQFLENRALECNAFLWHFLVFIITRFTKSIIYLQIINVFFSITTIYLILKYSPFKFHQKVLFCFGYYSIFEYSIISRSYALGLLLLIFSLVLYKEKRNNLLVATLILLANVNLLMSIIVFSFLIYLWLQKELKLNLLFLVFVGIGLALSDVASQFYINSQFDGVSTPNLTQLDKYWLIYKISLIYKGFFPIPDMFESHFWNTNGIQMIVYNEYYAHTIMAFFTVIILASSVYILKKKNIIIPFLVGNILFLILFGFFWGGSQRHWGYFFLLFLMYYWIYSLNEKNKLGNILFSVILILQLIGGFFAYSRTMNQPFSNSNNVANYIKKDKSKYVMTGFPDYTLTSISYYLDKEFYSIQSNEMESFINWNRPENITKDQALSTIIKLIANNDKVYVILSSQYNIELNNNIINSKKISFSSIKKFDNAIEIYENYTVLEVTK